MPNKGEEAEEPSFLGYIGTEPFLSLFFLSSCDEISRVTHLLFFSSLLMQGSCIDITDLKTAKINADKMAQAKTNFLANMRSALKI
jgi:hypothetical protein